MSLKVMLPAVNICYHPYTISNREILNFSVIIVTPAAMSTIAGIHVLLML